MRKKLLLLFSFIFVFTSCALPSADAASFQIDFSLTTQSMYLVNIDTGTAVFEQNIDEERAPASLTKIMTYIIVAEAVPDLEGTTITVPDNIVESLWGTGSSLSGVTAGETMSIADMLRCLMIPSGNDAAMALADFVGGGNTSHKILSEENVAKFVQMMNDKAKELGCEHTQFKNPHGLYDPQHYTTARDLYIMTNYALDLPLFTEIVSSASYRLSTDKRTNYPLISSNSLIDPNETRNNGLYYKYCKGIKTGTLDESGYCLASLASKGGYTYVSIALGAPSVDADGNKVTPNGAMVDTRKLFEWAFDNLEIKPIVDVERVMDTVPLEMAWQKDTLQLVPKESLSALLPKDVELSSIDYVSQLPESVPTPVQKGDVIGTATLSYANQELATVELVAAETVERSELLYYLQGARNVVTSKWFLIAISIFAFLFIVYLILSAMYNRRKKRRRKVKTYRKL
jgi:D-alanyl-D-alanine carboxypeptidase (penicillin-binding protein 5/6)